MRITPDDHARIADAIAGAETRTSGEIFCVLAGEVSDYRDVRLAWAAGLALLTPLVLIPLGFDASWLPGLGDGWRAAHIAAEPAAVGHAIAACVVIQAVVFALVLLITAVGPVRRWITPPMIRRRRVRKAAVQQFMAHGIQMTEARTGVLIFACLGDRRVEVVADDGIHAATDPEVWVQAVDALTTALRAGRPAEGFEAAVRLTGDVLAEHYPPRPRNPDELPNRLVVI